MAGETELICFEVAEATFIHACFQRLFVKFASSTVNAVIGARAFTVLTGVMTL